MKLIKFEDVKTDVCVFKCNRCGNHFAYEQGVVAKKVVNDENFYFDACPYCESDDFDIVKES